MLNTEQVKLYAEKYAATLDANGHETDASREFWAAEPVLNDGDRKAIAEEVAYLLKERAEQAAQELVEIAQEAGLYDEEASDSVSE